MKTILGRAGLLVAAMALATGCIQTKRYVTTQGWKDGDVAYFAYTEVAGFSSSAKVMKCARRDDNSLKCTEQTELNAFLNK